MDECTHLKNFAVPVDPFLSVVVAAEKDAYQTRDGVRPFHDIWTGAEVRYLPGAGHMSLYLFKQNIFKKVIYEVLDKLLMQQKTKQWIHPHVWGSPLKRMLAYQPTNGSDYFMTFSRKSPMHGASHPTFLSETTSRKLPTKTRINS